MPILTSLACELEQKDIQPGKIFLLSFLSLTCKITISIFIAGFGVREFLKNRKKIGSLLMILGTTWFALASNLIIPFYGGSSASLARHANRFGLNHDSIFAFNSIPENISTLSAQLLTTSNLEYLALLVAPAFFIFLVKRPVYRNKINSISSSADNQLAIYQP